jgi:hypothetical protein
VRDPLLELGSSSRVVADNGERISLLLDRLDQAGALDAAERVEDELT